MSPPLSWGRNNQGGEDTLFQCSTATTKTLIHYLLTYKPLCLKNHHSCICSTGASYCKTQKEGNKTFCITLMARATPKVKKWMEHLGATRAWLTTIPDSFGGTKLSRTEWHDVVSLQYGWHPQALPDHCDDCSEGFSVKHGLNYKKGGLISICHDYIRDKCAHLCSLSLFLSSNRITVKPTIFYCSNVSARNCGEQPPKAISTLAMKPDGTSLPTVSGKVPKGPSVTSMCVTRMPGPMVLKNASTKKKWKYEAPCLKQRCDFPPLVYYIDGLASKNTPAAEKCPASFLFKKWSQAYSEMVSFFQAWMSLAITRSTLLLL
ncbi:hypothetical protein ACHAW6_003095 [Cyclotella cf. meneghiniana]